MRLADKFSYRTIIVLVTLFTFSLFFNLDALAFTANRVRIEHWPKGLYRVIVSYTEPELQEFREAYIEFYSQKQAEDFYRDVVNGADIFLSSPSQKKFQNQEQQPRPW